MRPALGFSKGLAKYWSEVKKYIEDDDMEVSAEEDGDDGFPDKKIKSHKLIDEYSHENQIAYKSEITIKEKSTSEGHVGFNGKIEIRSGSGLVIFKSHGKKPDADNVFNKINRKVSSDSKISRKISTDRSNVWNLVRAADKVTNLEMSTAGGPITANAVNSYLQSETQNQQEYDDDAVGQFLRQNSVPESAKTIVDVDVDLRNYRVREARLLFQPTFDHPPTPVTYSNGILGLRWDTTEMRKYAVQQIEHNLLS